MDPQLWAVMPTYRRPDTLLRTLAALAQQTKVPDHLVIVDNGGDLGDRLEHEIRRPTAAGRVTVLHQQTNLGPAGALHVGLEHVLAHAPADAWVMTFDDDDPPQLPDTVERLYDTARQLLAGDPRVGAVGFGGSRFDRRRVRLRRLHNDELTGAPTRVAMLSGNHLPTARLAAVRDCGTYRRELFFGHDDLEFHLRMNARGWSVYCDTALLLRYRAARGRTGAPVTPSRRLGPPDWRRFYSVRNRVYVAREYAGAGPTARVVAEVLGKVVTNSLRDPRGAAAHLRLTLRACRDGYARRLGRTWQPQLTADGTLPSDAGKAARRALAAGRGN